MSDVIEHVGTFLQIFTVDRMEIKTMAEDEPVIDAAVSRWVESGKTRDTLLMLTCIDGELYKLLASMACSWTISTPEGREKGHRIHHALFAQRKARGLIDDE